MTDPIANLETRLRTIESRLDDLTAMVESIVRGLAIMAGRETEEVES